MPPRSRSLLLPLLNQNLRRNLRRNRDHRSHKLSRFRRRRRYQLQDGSRERGACRPRLSPERSDSTSSDLETCKLLLDYTNLIPKGLYLDRAMKVAKEELSHECNYELEAESQKRFRAMLSDTEGFYVPVVLDDISSKRVLTTELISGIPINLTGVLSTMNQSTRSLERQESNTSDKVQLFRIWEYMHAIMYIFVLGPGS